MFPSKLFMTFVSPPCEPQSRVGETATGHKERLEVVGVVRSQGPGVVTSAWSRLFEGKDEPVTTAGDAWPVEECRVPSRPVDQDYTHLYKHS